MEDQEEVLVNSKLLHSEAGETQVHAHVVLGRRDGTTKGGHLLDAHVRPTLKVILAESPEHLLRRWNEEVGLALIHP